VSLEQSRVCVVDGAGKIVREAKVASEPEAWLGFSVGWRPECLGSGSKRDLCRNGCMPVWSQPGLRWWCSRRGT
jgi:hypothetical protein